MSVKSKRVTVTCPRCGRNVTINTAVGDCQEHWCARCDTVFLVTLDSRGRIESVERGT